jgi:hypothetical protein
MVAQTLVWSLSRSWGEGAPKAGRGDIESKQVREVSL